MNLSKYSSLLVTLKSELDARFLDFKNHRNEMDLFANPFSTDVNTIGAKFQIDLINIQCGNSLKTAHTVKGSVDIL